MPPPQPASRYGATVASGTAHTASSDRSNGKESGLALPIFARIMDEVGAEPPGPAPTGEKPQKEVMLVKRGFRLTVTWSRGSVSITLEPY